MTDTETAGRILARVRARGPFWLGAHAALYAWDKAFDFVLYPLGLSRLGLLGGTAAMMLASFVVCLILLVLYDRLAATGWRDLLGFESMKEFSAELHNSWLARARPLQSGRWTRTVGAVILFFYLSLWFDPMTCTIFMRPADHHRMSLGYWTLFGASVLVSNLAWALLVFTGLETVGALLGAIAPWSTQP